MAMAMDQGIGRIYCIIDALDECDRESQKVLSQQLRDTFRNGTAMSNVRILVTSRPYPEIREDLEGFSHKDLASFPQREQDIDRCIEKRVEDLAQRKHYTDKVRMQVSDILREKAEGTFLWVGLACEELKCKPSKDAVQFLRGMPKGLHSLYKRLLDTALEEEEADNMDLIRRILSFVAVCLRPLSVTELSEACQLYQNEDVETRAQFMREQIASCRLMVIIQDEKVLLLHQSVKDYLVSNNAGSFIDELEAHAAMAHRCVGLLIDQFHSANQQRTDFSDYTTRHWPDHARMAQLSFKVQDLQLFFQWDSPCREQWLARLRSDWSLYPEIPQQFSILHIAARWGILALINHIHYSIVQKPGMGKSTFVQVDCIDNLGKTALQQAAASTYPDIVSGLLKLGGKVTTQAIVEAAGNWQSGKEVMALLLEHGDIPHH